MAFRLHCKPTSPSGHVVGIGANSLVGGQGSPFYAQLDREVQRADQLALVDRSELEDAAVVRPKAGAGSSWDPLVDGRWAGDAVGWGFHYGWAERATVDSGTKLGATTESAADMAAIEVL